MAIQPDYIIYRQQDGAIPFKSTYIPAAEAAPVREAADMETVTAGRLYDPAITELKDDQFPDRIVYWC